MGKSVRYEYVDILYTTTQNWNDSCVSDNWGDLISWLYWLFTGLEGCLIGFIVDTVELSCRVMRTLSLSRVSRKPVSFISAIMSSVMNSCLWQLNTLSCYLQRSSYVLSSHIEMRYQPFYGNCSLWLINGLMAANLSDEIILLVSRQEKGSRQLSTFPFAFSHSLICFEMSKTKQKITEQRALNLLETICIGYIGCSWKMSKFV